VRYTQSRCQRQSDEHGKGYCPFTVASHSLSFSRR
jgi:hypothetical protein